eukprot:6255615-Pyramimonas_sp.AAC.1
MFFSASGIDCLRDANRHQERAGLASGAKQRRTERHARCTSSGKAKVPPSDSQSAAPRSAQRRRSKSPGRRPKKSGGEPHSPVGTGLTRGLTSVSSPSHGAPPGAACYRSDPLLGHQRKMGGSAEFSGGRRSC